MTMLVYYAEETAKTQSLQVLKLSVVEVWHYYITSCTNVQTQLIVL